MITTIIIAISGILGVIIGHMLSIRNTRMMIVSEREKIRIMIEHENSKWIIEKRIEGLKSTRERLLNEYSIAAELAMLGYIEKENIEKMPLEIGFRQPEIYKNILSRYRLNKDEHAASIQIQSLIKSEIELIDKEINKYLS